MWDHAHQHAHVLISLWGHSACHGGAISSRRAHCPFGRVMFEKIVSTIIATVFVVLVIMGTMLVGVVGA